MVKINLNITFIVNKSNYEIRKYKNMIDIKRGLILLLSLHLLLTNLINAQSVPDDFIQLAKSSSFYTEFDDNFRVLILNIITHPDSYYKRSEQMTYLTFKVVNEEYQMVLDEAALDSNILNFQLLINSAYGRKSYYKLVNGEMNECWYKERGVTFSHNSENSSTIYRLKTGYYDFLEHVRKFNSFLTQKRTKNIKSKTLRRAYRLINSIRDTQYSRLQKMIRKYDKFIEKRLRKQEKKLSRAKKQEERLRSTKGVE